MSAAGQIITERADRVTPRRLRWLWPQRIPLGKITIFAGLPGEGKSLATIDVAARVTTGRAYPDVENPFDGKPGDVLFVSDEDDPEDALVPRLMAAGANLSRVHFLTAVRVTGSNEERDLRLDVDEAAIKDFLQTHPEILLIVIDPISNHLGNTSMVDEKAIRQLLKPLQRIARDRELSTTCVMHLNKKEGLAAINRVGGAGAFVGVARASWLFAHDGAGHAMAPLKNNYAKDSTKGLAYQIRDVLVTIQGFDEPIPRIEWLGVAAVDANELLEESKQAARRDAKSFLEKFLAGGPLPATDVIEAAAAKGISKRTLDRAKAALGVESRKNGQSGWEWALPTEQEQTKDATEGPGEAGTVGTLQSTVQ